MKRLLSGKCVLGQVVGQSLSWSIRYVDYSNHYCFVSAVPAYLSLFPIFVFFVMIVKVFLEYFSLICWSILSMLFTTASYCHEKFSPWIYELQFWIVNHGMCRYAMAVLNGNKSCGTGVEEEHTMFRLHLDVPSVLCRQVFDNVDLKVWTSLYWMHQKVLKEIWTIKYFLKAKQILYYRVLRARHFAPWCCACLASSRSWVLSLVLGEYCDL